MEINFKSNQGNPTPPSTSGIEKEPTQGHIANAEELKKAELSGQNIPISEEQLVLAIDRAVKAMAGNNTYLNFSVHSKTKSIMVKIMEQGTERVIREVPQEKMLDFVAKLWEMAGILVDEKR